IDRGADAGEVEPAAAPDIAVEDAAEMEGEAEPHLVLARWNRERRDIGARRPGGGKRPRRDGGGTSGSIAERKGGEKPVPHQLQHFAAGRRDRRNLAVEIAVQEIDELLRGEPVRPRGETAHVGEPDDGGDALDVAAPDVAGEDPLPGMMSD